MPAFSLAVSQAGSSVGFESNDRSAHSISHLADEQQHAGKGAPEPQDRVQVDQQVGEPHRGTQIVEKMPGGVTQTPAERQGPYLPLDRVTRLHDLDG